MPFTDRCAAGRRLAAALGHLRGEPLVVLGLPRGGVPVAAEVAQALGAPLDVIVVRKLGAPSQPELAMGAIGEDGVRVLDDDLVRRVGAGSAGAAEVEERERAELRRRAEVFHGTRPRVPLEGRTALVVDDGIATGSTARAACQVARAHGAARVVLAVPVAPPGWTARMGGAADEYVSVETPDPFFAIGQFYDDFAPTSDDEVLACLEQAAGAGRTDAGCGPAITLPRSDEVEVVAGGVRLAGQLTVPDGAPEVVVFAHGSGSSRHSPRNRYVAGVLNDAGLATLLLDLLSVHEESDRANVFDVELLADRLVHVVRWLGDQPSTRGLPVALYGASTGAAAALWAATEPGVDVAAIVSRGGRPDLAGPRLPAVTAPTLMVVGNQDDEVLDLNRQAQELLGRCESRLVVVPGATHLFEEPGTLHAAADAARDWFTGHLEPARSRVG